MVLPVFALSLRRVLARLNERAQRTLGAAFFGPETDVDLYHAHNEHVRQVVPKDRLLIFDPKGGFRPLCEFLDVPVPKDDQGRDLPYPHVNDRDAINKIMNRFVGVGWLIWGVSFAGLFYAAKRWVEVLRWIQI